jgi:mRNA-degrading endonuclease RelE of RelBE toxin-antitoxin system
MKFKKIEQLDRFKKDLKKLLKRFPSLLQDLNTFANAQLIAYHKLNIDNNGIFPLEGTGIQNPTIYKVKKFACRSLKGKGAHSGIRITYAYFSTDDRIEFIEIYYKGDQENEDKERIKEHYK